MKKIQLTLFSSILLITFVNAQQHIIVSVDGFFTNKDSSYVLEYVGAENIKKIVHIPPDSSQILLGEIGKSGILNFVSIDPKSNKSKHFRKRENLLFENNPSYFINNNQVPQSEISTINPSKIISVTILSQLRSVQLYGQEKRNGVVIIKARE